MPFPISKYFVNSPFMSSARSSSNLRVTCQPWFGALIAILIVAVVIGGSFALKAFGDSRTDSSVSGRRGAAGSDPSWPIRITFVNSSSFTIAVDVTNVKRGDWDYPAPDSAAPKGLRGAWIDPGQTVAVTLAVDSSTTMHAPFNVSTTPIAGSSKGGVITFYSQVNYGGIEMTAGTPSFWSWPTSERPTSLTDSSCSPTWSGSAGSYELKGGRTGAITATATCQGASDTTTVITFTDTKS
jgi:hypothetical protein